MSSDVDPRRVLQLINSMGYKNVSASELKEFTKDLKKLMKYEQKSKTTSEINPRLKQSPENIINVTIINGNNQKEAEQPPTTIPEAVNVQSQTETAKIEKPQDKRKSKKFLRLSKHIKTNNPKIVNKRGAAKSGVLVRNTPTDLFKKYQEDWAKFKSFIPGENDRVKVRNSVRNKMQQKDNEEAKVYVHFPDETGDH